MTWEITRPVNPPAWYEVCHSGFRCDGHGSNALVAERDHFLRIS